MGCLHPRSPVSENVSASRRGVAGQGASPLGNSGGQGARKVWTSDIPFPRLVPAHRGLARPIAV
jgi:hypothetical protein